jgi:chromosome segregation ATPase
VLQSKLASFLEARARTYGSKMLADLALRVTADPFTKVKKMIKDLIWKLMEEAEAETEHKGWCDTELGTNKLNRERETEELNQLTAAEEDLTAEIAELTMRIEELTKAIAELDEQRAKATEDQRSPRLPTSRPSSTPRRRRWLSRTPWLS